LALHLTDVKIKGKVALCEDNLTKAKNILINFFPEWQEQLIKLEKLKNQIYKNNYPGSQESSNEAHYKHKGRDPNLRTLGNSIGKNHRSVDKKIRNRDRSKSEKHRKRSSNSG
jgi:hypothetical protein